MNDEEMDDFVFLWKEYGKEDNSKLTSDAQELKKAVREHVQKMPKFMWQYQSGCFKVQH